MACQGLEPLLRQAGKDLLGGFRLLLCPQVGHLGAMQGHRFKGSFQLGLDQFENGRNRDDGRDDVVELTLEPTLWEHHPAEDHVPAIGELLAHPRQVAQGVLNGKETILENLQFRSIRALGQHQAADHGLSRGVVAWHRFQPEAPGWAFCPVPYHKKGARPALAGGDQ